MNGCSREILHFITIYFTPVESGVAQQGQQRGRNKHKPNHTFLLFLFHKHTQNHTLVLGNINSQSAWGIFWGICSYLFYFVLVLQAGLIYHVICFEPSAWSCLQIKKIRVHACLCEYISLWECILRLYSSQPESSHICHSLQLDSGLTLTLA